MEDQWLLEGVGDTKVFYGAWGRAQEEDRYANDSWYLVASSVTN